MIEGANHRRARLHFFDGAFVVVHGDLIADRERIREQDQHTGGDEQLTQTTDSHPPALAGDRRLVDDSLAHDAASAWLSSSGPAYAGSWRRGAGAAR